MFTKRSEENKNVSVLSVGHLQELQIEVSVKFSSMSSFPKRCTVGLLSLVYKWKSYLALYCNSLNVIIFVKMVKKKVKTKIVFFLTELRGKKLKVV